METPIQTKYFRKSRIPGQASGNSFPWPADLPRNDSGVEGQRKDRLCRLCLLQTVKLPPKKLARIQGQTSKSRLYFTGQAVIGQYLPHGALAARRCKRNKRSRGSSKSRGMGKLAVRQAEQAAGHHERSSTGNWPPLVAHQHQHQHSSPAAACLGGHQRTPIAQPAPVLPVAPLRQPARGNRQAFFASKKAALGPTSSATPHIVIDIAATHRDPSPLPSPLLNSTTPRRRRSTAAMSALRQRAALLARVARPARPFAVTTQANRSYAAGHDHHDDHHHHHHEAPHNVEEPLGVRCQPVGGLPLAAPADGHRVAG